MIKCTMENSCPKGKICCCCNCDEAKECGSLCDNLDNMASCGFCEMDESDALVVFKSQSAAVIQSITDIVTAKKALEDQEKEMKEQLQTAMEKYGVKSFDAGTVKMTYIEASVRNSIDSAKLKKKYPDIAAECGKSSPVKAYVKIEVK